MAKRMKFDTAARLAIANTLRFGDTDIFPFPFERFVFQDNVDKSASLLKQIDSQFDDNLTKYPPHNEHALTPTGYFGFRWATQIDFLWNAYFLSCVLVLAESIEEARVKRSVNRVFSYRIDIDHTSGRIFSDDIGFRTFISESIRLSSDHKFVVLCDISEFYPRLGHHRLENALKQVDGRSNYPKKILRFLGNFSRTNSFGLPIGGPASRILSEITINQVDQLLVGRGIAFTRFADDYHIFADSREDAYSKLIVLSEKLSLNQGLTLQKSKTRIMSAAEFGATLPQRSIADTDGETSGPSDQRTDSDKTTNLMSFSLRFDPYSTNAAEDYERLRDELKKYDILSMLRDELGKTKIHGSVVKRLIRAIRFIDDDLRDEAVVSLLSNSDLLYPVFSSVLILIDQIIPDLSVRTKTTIKDMIIDLIKSDSHVLRLDIHLAFAIRVLSHFNEPEIVSMLQGLYEARNSAMIRRDVILVMGRWGEWYWLSDVKNRFRTLSVPERRAFIVTSYKLKDEGNHWRQHIRSELSPHEDLIRDWASNKSSDSKWKTAL